MFANSASTPVQQLVSNLKTHMLTHSGKKPFSCTQCNYSSATSGDLKKHIQERNLSIAYSAISPAQELITSSKSHMLFNTRERNLPGAHSVTTLAHKLVNSRGTNGHILGKSPSGVSSVIILVLRVMISKSTNSNTLEKKHLHVSSAVSLVFAPMV